MKRIGTILFVLHFVFGGAQNLVPNPSFEDTLANPNWNSEPIQNSCMYWFGPPPGTTDYYNDLNPLCIGCASAFAHIPKTGLAFAGIYTFISDPSLNEDLREMLCVQLSDTLQAGRNYQVVFYVARAWWCSYACNNVGAFFSESPQLNSNMTTTLPHIENDPNLQLLDTSWVKISGEYTALGNELYLTIGNFNSNSTSDTNYIGGGVNNQLLAYYIVDDVSVTPIVEPLDTLFPFELYPNPSDGQFVIRGTFPTGVQFEVYNMLGQPVSDPIEIAEGSGTTPVDLNLAQGVYYYRLTIAGEFWTEGRIVVAK